MTQLAIATANTRRSTKWENKKLTWRVFLDEWLEETARTKETLKQYYSYSKEKQDEIKDVGGFVGGYIKGGRRLKGAVTYRQVLTLDVDHASDLSAWESFKLLGFAGCMYSTHKHKPEAPRYRIIIPVSDKMEPDLYEAVARSVAVWLDIEQFDDTTFQAERLMYFPSTSKDGEYLYEEVDGEWLTIDEAIEGLEDWKDPTTWPVSSRVKESIRHKTSDKVQPPEQKEGIIGAFCRAYPMSSAIGEFVEDYRPGSEDARYTFIGGSTSDGVIIYNDNMSYSWHATDPAGGRLCNAFDLVRIHKFGDLDTEQKDDVTKLASYKEMVSFAGKLTSVKREILATRRDTADDYDSDDDEVYEVSDEWLEDLETERNGDTKNSIANVVLILSNDEKLKGRFGFNEFEQRETATKPLPWDHKGLKYPRALVDADDAQLRLFLEKRYDITGKGQIQDGLTVVVRNNMYHPVKEYLQRCNWDGTARLDEVLINTLGAPETEYVRTVTRKVFVAAVARIFEPGVKFDQMTVILGPQGLGKSTFIKRIGQHWFSDSISDVRGKDAVEAIQGNWIIELAELAGMRKADVETVKHFVGKSEDKFRVAYGKRTDIFPRRCIFFGTTNEMDFLKDVTGNRRFWIINTFEGNNIVSVWEFMTQDMVDQLWAEARHYYENGETLLLPARVELEARRIQAQHLERDERAGIVEEYLDRKLPATWYDMEPDKRLSWLSDSANGGTVQRQYISLIEIWCECLGGTGTTIPRTESYHLARLMKSIEGWTLRGASMRIKGYGPQKVFERQA